jgi:hypothetical protein
MNDGVDALKIGRIVTGKPIMLRLLYPALAASLCLVSFAASAQAPAGPSTRIRGTVEAVDGSNLVVKTRGGQNVDVQLAPGFSVSGVVKRELADIKPGDFVASTSVRTPEGNLRAMEVHFLSAGASELQVPYDLVPDSLMTNAIVAGVTNSAEGRTLRVTYKGTEAEIFVPLTAPVVAFVPGDPALLKPGSAIVLSANRKPDGTLTASRATLEKDGVKPPM